MIASIAWARRGAPARVPTTEAQLDEGLEDADGSAAAVRNGAGSQGKKRAGSGSKRAAVVEEEEDEDEAGIEKVTAGNLTYYHNNKEDPYLQLGEDGDVDSEIDDYEIGDTDLVLLGARSDEQLSNLEVFVYEEPHDNLYPHHDVPLPVFPLCVEWLDFHPGGTADTSSRSRGNYAAVGTFAPYIEVWDLDMIDALEPVIILGAEAAAAAADNQFTSAAAEALAASARQRGDKSSAAGDGDAKKAKRKKKLGGGSGPQGHSDAVMCLAWNPIQPNAIASGSADSTVRLWDLEGECSGSVHCLTSHSNKVQSLAWHPSDAALLLSAGFDRLAIVQDVRTPSSARKWSLTSDAERVCWHPSGDSFVVSSEDGLVKCFDARSGGTQPLWSLQAHREATTGLSFCPAAPDILATGGQDKLAKLWALPPSTDPSQPPRLLGKRNMMLGALFDIKFSLDAPALLGAGGSKGKVSRRLPVAPRAQTATYGKRCRP